MYHHDGDSSVEEQQQQNTHPAPRILNKIPLKPPTNQIQRSPLMPQLPNEAKTVHRTMTSSTEEDDDTLGSNYSNDYLNSLAEFRSRVMASHTDIREATGGYNNSHINNNSNAITPKLNIKAPSAAPSPFNNNRTKNETSSEAPTTSTSHGRNGNSMHGRDSPLMATKDSYTTVSTSIQSQSFHAPTQTVHPEKRLLYPSKSKNESMNSSLRSLSSSTSGSDTLISSVQQESMSRSVESMSEKAMDNEPADMNIYVSAISMDHSTSEWDIQSSQDHDYLSASFGQRTSPFEDSMDMGIRDKYWLDTNESHDTSCPIEADTTLLISNRSQHAFNNLTSSSLENVPENGYISAGSESSDETTDEIAECVADVNCSLTDLRIAHDDKSERSTSPTRRSLGAPISSPILFHENNKEEEELCEKSMTSHSSECSTSTPDVAKDGTESLVSYLHSAASKHLSRGDHSKAISCFERVLRIHETIHGRIHFLVASTYHNIGIVYLKQVNAISAKLGKSQASKDEKNNWTNDLCHTRILAISAFRDAALIARDALGEDHPNIATSLIRIGFLLLDVVQHSNALATFQEALRIRKKSFGERHPLVSKVCNNIGVAHLKLGHFQSGYESFIYALETQRSMLSNPDGIETTATRVPKNHDSNSLELDIADTLYNVGTLCVEWSKLDTYDAEELFSQRDLVDMAISYFEEGVAIRGRLLGNMHIQTLHAQILLKRAKIELKNMECDKDHDNLTDPESPNPGVYKATETSNSSNTTLMSKARTRILYDNVSEMSSSSISSVGLNSLPGKVTSEQQRNHSMPKSLGSRRSRRSTVLEKSDVTISAHKVVPLYNADLVQSNNVEALSPNPSYPGILKDKYSNNYDEEESCMISGDDPKDCIDDNGNISSVSSADMAKRITVFRAKPENTAGVTGFEEEEESFRKDLSQSNKPIVDSKRLFQSPMIGGSKFPQSIESAVDHESCLKDPIRFSVEVHNIAVNYLKVSLSLCVMVLYFLPDYVQRISKH